MYNGNEENGGIGKMAEPNGDGDVYILYGEYM